MTEGIGEIRKFLSPEDEQLLKNARDVEIPAEENGIPSDPAGRRELISRRVDEAKKIVRERMQREVYSRARDFGDELIKTYEAEQYLPWKQIKMALEGKASFVKDRHKYEAILSKISGLSQEQKLIFRSIVEIAEEDHLRTQTALTALSNLSVGEAISRRAGRSKGEIHFDQEAVGRTLFTAVDKNSGKPKGKAWCVNKGLYAELYLDNEEDIQRLYSPEDVVVGTDAASQKKKFVKKIGGFFSSDKNISIPNVVVAKMAGLSLPLDGQCSMPIIVIYAAKGNPEQNESVGHERGHYYNHLADMAISRNRNTASKTPDKLRIAQIEEKIGVIGETSDEVEIIKLRENYRRRLVEMKGNFLKQAKNEILADWHATGNFNYLSSLLEREESAEERGEEALYDYFHKEFGKRWRVLPESVKDLIVSTQRQYYSELELCVGTAKEISDMIRKFKMYSRVGEHSYSVPEKNKYTQSLDALLQDSPILEWKIKLDAAYGHDLAVFRDYLSLSQRFCDAEEFFAANKQYSDWSDRNIAQRIINNFIFDTDGIGLRSADLNDFPAAYKEKRDEIEKDVDEIEQFIGGFRKKVGVK